MSETSEIAARQAIPDQSGWQELWRTEDWWAVRLGLGLTAAAYLRSRAVRLRVRRLLGEPGRGSVRAADGLCSRHGLYLGSDAYCDDHKAREP